MSTILKITDFVILRDIVPSGTKKHDCPRGEPLSVATLLDEADFLKMPVLIQHRNAFLEAPGHDWTYADGKLRYFSHIRTDSDVGNTVVLVYGQEEVPVAMNFCPETGKRLTPEPAEQQAAPATA